MKQQQKELNQQQLNRLDKVEEEPKAAKRGVVLLSSYPMVGRIYLDYPIEISAK